MPGFALIGDIGGTNARLALTDIETGEITHIQGFSTCDYPSLEAVITIYLESISHRITRACLAIASPVNDNWIEMTNNSWAFSPKILKQNLRLEQLEIINDFTAVSLSITKLSANCTLKIGGNEPKFGYPKAVYGAGTGLGVSCLLHHEDWIVIPGEGGHVDYAATNEEEEILCSIMRANLGHLSAEKLLSGQGLVNIYRAIVEADERAAENLTPAEITKRAIENSDKDCYRTVSLFCTVMGRFGGNLALTYGAAGGVYIAGGIVPKIREFFLRSGFRAAFEDKGRFSDWLKDIPVYLIIHDCPGLTGAVVWLQRSIKLLNHAANQSSTQA